MFTQAEKILKKHLVGLTEPYSVGIFLISSRLNYETLQTGLGTLSSVQPAVRRFDISTVGPYLTVLLGQTNQALVVMSGDGVGLT